MGRAIASVVAVVVALAPAEPRANACVCQQIPAALVWPVPDATAVPLDTALVVLSSNPITVLGDAGSVTSTGILYRLTDETGTEVPLTTVRTLESDRNCTLQNYGFLRPSAGLVPGRRYTLDAQFEGIDVAAAPGIQSSFTTGAEARGPFAPPVVNLWLFAEEVTSGRLLQLFASTGGREPVFVSAPGGPWRVVRGLGPLALQDPVGLSLGEVSCADVELIDATGSTFRSEQLCAPQKCSWPPVVRGASSCGRNIGGDSWENWQQRPSGCERPRDGGCGVAGADAPASSSLVATAALLFLLGARPRFSRPRSGTRPTPIRS